MTFWRFRPTALSLRNYATLSVETLIDHYDQDNERAAKDDDDVEVLPKSPFANIRTLQWNIHSWATPQNEQNSKIRNGVINTILDANADVMVLNEYYWDVREEGCAKLEEILTGKGYSFFCATVFAPTFLATRLPVWESREIIMSEERSALAVKVQVDAEMVWVIGTHLDHMDGKQRQLEMQTLLQELDVFVKPDERVILMGDLNQQRRQDYSKKEWKLVSENMDRRRTCQDDGVSTLLQNTNFTCSWDGLLPASKKCNWETSKPPSTHWSGTIVDYSYGRNLQPEGVSVSPAGWSDHRMTVCDWRWR